LAFSKIISQPKTFARRTEEGRVGEEGGYRWWADH